MFVADVDRSWSRVRDPRIWLAIVAVAHAVSPLVLLGVHWWLGVDETVYLSQINGHVPPGFFSAPRARGTTFVAAPVTLLTDSVVAVRLWLAALAGVALYAAFAPWLRLWRGAVVPLAALLFSTVWSVVFYAFAAMPNEYVAYAAVAACGLFVRFLLTGRRRHAVGVGVAVALMALFRPSDAMYAVAALAVCAVFVRAAPRRRIAAAAAAVLGCAAGLADWVIEAYTTYGGLSTRIHLAQGENGGGGLHLGGAAAEARALDGPLLCRWTCHADAAFIYRAWWGAAAVLIVAGVALAVRRGAPRPMATVVPAVVGATLAAQYMVTVPYAAPRFLIPAYALLAVPCAVALCAAVERARSVRFRVAAGAVLALGVAAQVIVQAHVIVSRVAPPSRFASHSLTADARELRGLGVHGPCLVLGEVDPNQQLAYALRCTNQPTRPALVRQRIADGTKAVWLRRAMPTAYYGVSWRPCLLPGANPSTTVRAYVSLSPHRGRNAAADRRS